MRIQKLLGNEYVQFMKEQLNERKINDAFGIKQLDMIDLEVCNYVINQMIPMDIDKINMGRKINALDLVEIGLRELEKMGNSVSTDAEKMTFITPIITIDTDDCFQMTTAISYEITDDGVLENSGQVSKFIIPQNLYEISGCFFGHEQLHAMKDVNYKEYVNQRRLGEVIPIFYEFMIYSPEEVIKKEILKVRMNNIFNNISEYDLFYNAFRDNRLNEIILGDDEVSNIKSNVYEYCMTKVGCYLNSFYYALVLYNMYKQTPQKVLDLISKVLKHEMTTIEMLDSLGIYGDIRGEIFEKEIRNVKKLIK
jgi:hypothetical protein